MCSLTMRLIYDYYLVCQIDTQGFARSLQEKKIIRQQH